MGGSNRLNRLLDASVSAVASWSCERSAKCVVFALVVCPRPCQDEGKRNWGWHPEAPVPQSEARRLVLPPPLLQLGTFANFALHLPECGHPTGFPAIQQCFNNHWGRPITAHQHRPAPTRQTMIFRTAEVGFPSFPFVGGSLKRTMAVQGQQFAFL